MDFSLFKFKYMRLNENKIFKYDFLIVGAGLIGALTAFALHKKNYKVLVIDKNNDILKDERTLAVNANSKEFLERLAFGLIFFKTSNNKKNCY